MKLTKDQHYRILIVTDAWYPNVNGVVTAVDNLAREMKLMGHTVLVITPQDFFSIPELSDPTVRLSVNVAWKLPQMIDQFGPDMIHVSTEACLGYGARAYCLQRGLPFTTAFHSKLPEYIEQHTGFPADWTYAVLKGFHSKAETVLVATQTLQMHLKEKWSLVSSSKRKGATTMDVQVAQCLAVADTFQPSSHSSDDSEQHHQEDDTFTAMLDALPRPVHLYVGRIAVEKNIRGFLDLNLPEDGQGSKLVVGDGPMLSTFQKEYPGAVFVGYKTGKELLQCYQAADVLVFPSKTDTFGLVMLEALACGVPVAASPVPGPMDVITNPKVGVLDHDLEAAAQRALTLSPQDCRAFAKQFTWSKAAERFLQSQVLIDHDQTSTWSTTTPRTRTMLFLLWDRLHALFRFLHLLIETWQVIAVLYGLYPICVTLTYLSQLQQRRLRHRQLETRKIKEVASGVTWEGQQPEYSQVNPLCDGR